MRRFISVFCVSIMLAGCATGNAGNNAGNAAPPPALSGKVEGEITVSCFDSMTYKTYLEDAVALFELKYPGTKVNIETVSKMPEIKTSEDNGKMIAVITKEDDNPAEQSDYISKISTELMGGGGPDIIAADIIPFINYSENGQLIDLKSFMEQDGEWNSDDYIKNVFEAVQYNGGQYILPVNYSFNYLTYDSSILDADDAFSNTIEGLIEEGAAAFMDINSTATDHVYMFALTDNVTQRPNMFSTLLAENLTEFIDVAAKKVNLNDGKFEELLETIKKLGEEEYIKRASSQTKPGDKPPSPEEIEKMRSEQIMYKQKSSEMMFMEFNKNSNVQMFIAGAGGSGKDDEIIDVSHNSDGNVPFTFNQAFGINSNTKNAETAWAFLKFLLSDEMQGSLNVRGLPVNNAARANAAEMRMKGQMGGGFAVAAPTQKKMGSENADSQKEPEDIELNQEALETLEEYKSAIEQFSAKLNTYLIQDTTINNMLEQEVKYFFDGTKSAKEVADVLQSKIELYINE